MNNLTTKHKDVNCQEIGWDGETFGHQEGGGRVEATRQGCPSASVHHKKTQEDWPPHLDSLELDSLTQQSGASCAGQLNTVTSATHTSEGAGLTDTQQSGASHAGQPNTDRACFSLLRSLVKELDPLTPTSLRCNMLDNPTSSPVWWNLCSLHLVTVVTARQLVP